MNKFLFAAAAATLLTACSQKTPMDSFACPGLRNCDSGLILVSRGKWHNSGSRQEMTTLSTYTFGGVHVDVAASDVLDQRLIAHLERQAAVDSSGSPLQYRSCKSKQTPSGWDVFCTSVGMYGAYIDDHYRHRRYGGNGIQYGSNGRNKLNTRDAAEFILGR